MRGFRRGGDAWLEGGARNEGDDDPSRLSARPPAGSSRALLERMPTRVRIGLLLALTAVVSAAGILVGRSLTPARSSSAGVVSRPPRPAATVPRPRRRLAARWGPLQAAVVARLDPQAGSVGASAALAGARLVVTGGPQADLVYAGRLGGRFSRVATLPAPHAFAVMFAAGDAVYLIGGERGRKPDNALTRIDPRSGQLSAAGVFEEPLAESGLAIDGASRYIVGGWTGQRYATAILRLTPPGAVSLLARLPIGLAYPAVAALGGHIYVAGGRTRSGVSRALFAIDTSSGAVTSIGVLREPVEQALLVVSGRALYLLGGRGANGRPLDTVARIDPASGAVHPAGRLPRPLAGLAALPVAGRTLVVVGGLVYRLG